LGNPSVVSRVWLLPLWLPVLLIAALTALCGHLDRPPKAGHCPACNYDLTGNTTGRCPECGCPFAPSAFGPHDCRRDEP
jgi:hypothetical protein